MDVKLKLRLFGTFNAWLGDVPIEGFRSAKVRALLAYLGVETSKAHRREALATLLWGEYPQRQAMQSLSQALTNLRSLISAGTTAEESHLKTTRQIVMLNSDPERLWVDVHAFDSLLLAANPHRTSALGDIDIIGSLEEAVALYQGPFLSGLSLPDNLEFEEWLMLQREQRHQAMQIALTRLISHHMSEGHMGLVGYYARQQLALEPWNENGHKALMLALAMEGQRGAALQQYETCCRVLAEEMDVKPSAEIDALAQQIRSGVALHFMAGTNLTRPHFVARKEELTRLNQWLDRTLAGQGRVAMVIGEAGTGKTTLLSRFTQRAQESHHRLVVIGGRCSSYAGMGDPLLPFREILQGLMGEIHDDWLGSENPEYASRLLALFPYAAKALLSEGAGLIGRLVSTESLAVRAEKMDLQDAPWQSLLVQHLEHSHHGSLGNSVQKTAPLQQDVLFNQVVRVLQAIAQKQPLLVLIDDLQWADTASLSLLFHLGQRIQDSRILVVGAYRPSEVTAYLKLPITKGKSSRHPLQAMENEFSRLWGDIWIDLDQADGQRFVDALLDGEPNRLTQRFRNELMQHTSGQPLFTIELLRAFQERGDLTHDEEGRWIEGPDLRWEELPPRVEAVIAERISRLPGDRRRLLEVASVEGEFFSAEVIANAMGIKPAVAIKWLSGSLSREARLVNAVGLQALSSGGNPLSRYRFSHALFQDYLYRSLDVVDRGHLHRKVGDALERLFRDDEAALSLKSPQLAQHYAEANAPLKAARYYLAAGRWAVRLAAYDEAVTTLKQGLAQMERIADSRDRLHLELGLYTTMTMPLMMQQGLNSPAYMQALARLSELVQHPDLQDSSQRLAALTVLALSAGWSANPDRIERVGQQLLDLVLSNEPGDDQSVDHQIRLLGHWALGFSRWLQGQPRPALEHLTHAVDLYNPESYRSLGGSLVGDPGVMARAMLGAVQWQLGYPDQARACFQQAVSQAKSLKQPSSVVFAHYIAAMTTSIVGRDRDAAFHHAEILRPLGEISVVYRAWAEMLTGQAELECGQAGVRAVKSKINEDMARVVEAGSAWEAAGSGGGYAGLMLLQAEVCAGVGHVEMGLSAIDQAQEWIERTGMRATEAEIWRMRAELLLKADDPGLLAGTGKSAIQPSSVSEAEICFQHALAIARKQQARIFELRAALGLARLWVSQGQHEEAKVLLSDIYNWFSEGFDTEDLIAAKALLDDLG